MGLAKIVTKNKVEMYTSQHGLGTGFTGFPAGDNSLLIFTNDKIQHFDPADGSFETKSHFRFPFTSRCPILTFLLWF